MSVTEDVFHELMSSLNVSLSLNSSFMSVMRPVSQFVIWPYVPIAERSSLNHRFTAAWSSVLLVNV